MSLHGTLAVISQRACTLTFFDLNTGEQVLHVPDLPLQPHELAYDAKRKLLYISRTYDNGWFFQHGAYGQDIDVFDIEQRKLLDSISVAPYGGPHGLRMDADGILLYASVEDGFEGAGGVLGINLASRKITKKAPSGGAHSHWFVLTKDCKKAYTTNKDKGVSVLDLETGALVKKLDIPGSEEGDISTDGRFAYYPFPALKPAEYGKGEVGFKVIDTTTDEVVKTVLTELPIMSILATPHGKIMVAHANMTHNERLGRLAPANGVLSLYDAETYELEGQVQIGVMPLTMRVDAAGSIGVIAGMFCGTVSVVDLRSMKVKMVLEVDTEVVQGGLPEGRAHGMAFIP